MHFEWDENKNLINQKKHGISFSEIVDVFADEFAILFSDPDHSELEERFLIIGMSNTKGVCLVSHCYRNAETKIRIISARKATKSERSIYDEQFACEVNEMRAEYDIRNLNPRKNPYVNVLPKPETINLDEKVISYFKSQAETIGIPYQKLINLYLQDCVNNNKKLHLSWE